ncbi:hypothetical protein [Silanimonas sp.]|jgi:hypothetical protein|uniref:hypothetical protein n=1 Tax=Silanimonas sp. TaxID=1929290 RepID=UPI0022C541CB|nr:hypothetical protein [Silanimonas sp.]MCZ8062406.1 hypothetical protein [Silanimonas sp.]
MGWRFFAGFLAMVAGPCWSAAHTTARHDFMVGIDRAAWVDPSPTRWPGSHESVRFVVGDSIEVTCLPQPGKRQITPPLFLGLLCGEPVVLMAPAASLAPDDVARYVAHHEAFHLVIQRMTARIPMNALSPWPPDAELLGMAAFSEDVQAAMTHTSEVACLRVRHAINRLSPTERVYLMNVSHNEWPADAYATLVTWGSLDVAKSRALRGRISADPEDDTPGYAPGVAVVRRIEAEIGRAEWQRRYQSGQHLLNILADALGCEPWVESVGSGKVARLSDFAGGSFHLLRRTREAR